jgi:hypothetical protein
VIVRGIVLILLVRLYELGLIVMALLTLRAWLQKPSALSPATRGLRPWRWALTAALAAMAIGMSIIDQITPA